MNQFAASSRLVNRTHRIVREQALTMREQRRKKRSLWAPLFISSALVSIIVYAAWSLLDVYDLTSTGIPDCSSQLMIFLMWSLPISALLIGVAYARRARNHGDSAR
ncbi:MAG: hypothetical protein PW735_12840 [Acidobacteriaceae bacterium]|nr:hypothetical protein [Acidobacteriaceae bacterium]